MIPKEVQLGFLSPPVESRYLACVDLFAGCGGLSLGLENAGFRPVIYSEISDSASKSYEYNRANRCPARFRETRHLLDRRLNATSLSLDAERILANIEVDLVCGGPPCQGYSGIGHRRTYAIDRKDIPSNHLYQDMADVVRCITPKIFLFENVRGLLSNKWSETGKKGEIWRDVFSYFFQQLNKDYWIAWELVQASHYGVPQHRPRILLVGVRKDVLVAPQPDLADVSSNWSTASSAILSTEAIQQFRKAVRWGLLPEPTPGSSPDLQDVLGDLIDPAYKPGLKCTLEYPIQAITKLQKSYRQGSSNLTDHVYSNHCPRVVERFRCLRNGKVPDRLKTKKFSQRVLPARWLSEPNITACSLPDDYVHFEQDRSLTVREWARLQGFPDSYTFCGPRTTGGHRRAGNPHAGIWDREVCKYTQIGNAVPVQLARELGSHFAKLLRRNTTEQPTKTGKATRRRKERANRKSLVPC